MTSATDARQLYKELQAHTDTVGAFTFGSVEDERRLRFSDRLTSASRECHVVPAAQVTDTPARLLIEAPSPWHALAHLLIEHRNWLAGRYASGRQMALIYRGQADVAWPLIPSRFRDGTLADEERDTTRGFSSLVARFLFRQMFTNFAGTHTLSYLSDYLLVPEILHVAAAQHYGLRTPLLDFTTDPAVAIWFACHSGSSARGSKAVVFAIPSDVAAFAGATILFPHPYVRRLYRQHGVFVSGLDNSDRLRPLSIEVRFPRDSSFQVLRGDRAVDLLGDATPEDGDDWWASQVTTARWIVKQGLLEAVLALPYTNDGFLQLAEMIDSEQDDYWIFPEWLALDNRQRIVRESTVELLQMLLSLTTALDGTTSRVSTSAVGTLAEHSGFSLGTMLPLMRSFVSSLPNRAPLRIASQPALDRVADAVPVFR